MPSLSELRKKIKGVKSTRQITNAMKMVAGARIARATRAMGDAGTFAAEIDKVLKSYILAAGISHRNTRFVAGPDAPEPAEHRIGVVMLAGDKGLCGDFNDSVGREVNRYMEQRGEQVIRVFGIGRKACDHLRRSNLPKERVHEYPNVLNKLSFDQIAPIARDIVKDFAASSLSEVVIIYNNFVSAAKHALTRERLLPVTFDPKASGILGEAIYEPSDMIIADVLPLWLESRLYNMTRRSFAAELSARMAAMANATKNADEMVDKLTLEVNKVRQAVITRELTEIVTTGEVMKE